jgi:D-alanine-D-alanine ligase
LANKNISKQVQLQLKAAAKVLGVEGYCRIDAFVRIFTNNKVEVVFIEVNSLPGMTPATAIFHQCALNNYKPYEFIDKILQFGDERLASKKLAH